jgi:hypothetical protein
LNAPLAYASAVLRHFYSAAWPFRLQFFLLFFSILPLFLSRSIIFPIGFDTFRLYRDQSRDVYLAIFSTKYTYQTRLINLTNYLYSHPAIPGRIHPHVFVPPDVLPPEIPAPIHVVQSDADKGIGLCRREESAYRRFLNSTDIGWLYRAIDDTWIMPDNLLDFVDELVSFIDPMTDIVIKASKNYRGYFRCAPWLDGGLGWLVSRAAVMHILEYSFAELCGQVYFNQDDTTTGLIACHTFPDHRAWNCWRLPGNPYYSEAGFPQMDTNAAPCPDGDVWPIQKLIAVHVHDSRWAEEAVRGARDAPPDLAYWADGGQFRICRGDPAAMAIATDWETLRRWTPIVKFQKGGQMMSWDLTSEPGPVACRQCTGMHRDPEMPEDVRIALWNASGWPGYYGSVSRADVAHLNVT